MDKFVDEKIMAMMKESEEADEAKTSGASSEEELLTTAKALIQEPMVKIGSEWMPFEDRLVLNETIWVRMPRAFKEMPVEVTKLKYPSQHRPNLIFSDESTTVNLAFNFSKTPLADDEMEDFTEAIVKLLKRTQPTAEWIKQDVLDVEGKPIGYCSFIVPVVDSDLYQLMFFAAVNDRALLCTFNCLQEDMEDWQTAALGMMQSLRMAELKKGVVER